MSRLPSLPSVSARHLAVTAVLVGVCCTPAFAMSGGAAHPARRDPVPPKVARCLAKPTGSQRGACFRRTFGRHIPRRVSRCLAIRGERARSRCFRRTFGVATGIPPAVAQCLAEGESQRASCFASRFGSGVPAWVTTCLGKPESDRAACFVDAAGGDVPAFVARCLAKPDSERGDCFAK